VFQVDGKVRAVESAPAGLGERQATTLATANTRVRDAVAGRRVVRVVVVPDRVVNVVTAPR